MHVRKTYSRFLLCALLLPAIGGFASTSAGAEAQKGVSVPPIETWTKTSEFRQGGNPLIFRWYVDRNREEYNAGLIIFFVDSPDNEMPIVKAWDFEHTEVKLEKARTALLMENGRWEVGELGERILFLPRYDRGPDNTVKAVGVTFFFEHSNISRTFYFKNYYKQ